jgi:glutathione S-transferase
MDFTSVHNIHEQPVFDAVAGAAPGYPALAGSHELLADVACVALNRVSARYIRHDVDLAFFLSEKDRADNQRAILDAVDYGFKFVQARHALAARR